MPRWARLGVVLATLGACDAGDADPARQADAGPTSRLLLTDGRIIEGFRTDDEVTAVMLGPSGLQDDVVAQAVWDLRDDEILLDSPEEELDGARPGLVDDGSDDPPELRLSKWLFLQIEEHEGLAPVASGDLAGATEPQTALPFGLKGYFDSLVRVGDEFRVRGWTCDSGNYAAAVRVWITVAYFGNGIWTAVGPYTANRNREAAVGANCGGHANRGFDVTTGGLARMDLTHNAAFGTVRVKIQPVDTQFAGMPDETTFLIVGGRVDGLRFLPAGWRPWWAI
jgi:hypothetical protein